MIVGAIDTPTVDWLALAPALAPLAAAGLALLGSVLVPAAARRAFAALVTFAGFVAAGVFAAVLYDRTDGPVGLIADSMTRDRLGALTQVILAAVCAVVVLLSYGDRRRDHVGEYFTLIGVAGAGMIFFVSAGNLMTLFLGLEWFSIALYILCAMDTHRRESLEAGLKYLIVGSFGSGILLFGCALTYGATGELGFQAIRDAPAADSPLFVVGMALIIAGLAFKVSAAPFHMWTPDVYQGAPTTVTSFMATATKVAALVVTFRVLATAFPEQSELWRIAIAVLVVASLVVGNLGALAQSDIKRLLAYSSISHAGFALMAVAADTELGVKALVFYLVPYAAATLGAFAVVAARERELDRPVSLAALEGLGWERPFHGIAMWVFMLSFAGFPLTGGFLGKFFVFSAIYNAGWWWLAVIGLVATAVSLAYYLSVIRAMYMRPSQVTGTIVAAGGATRRDLGLDAAIAVVLVVTVGTFFLAGPLADLARDSATTLLF